MQYRKKERKKETLTLSPVLCRHDVRPAASHPASTPTTETAYASGHAATHAPVHAFPVHVPGPSTATTAGSTATTHVTDRPHRTTGNQPGTAGSGLRPNYPSAKARTWYPYTVSPGANVHATETEQNSAGSQTIWTGSSGTFE